MHNMFYRYRYLLNHPWFILFTVCAVLVGVGTFVYSIVRCGGSILWYGSEIGFWLAMTGKCHL